RGLRGGRASHSSGRAAHRGRHAAPRSRRVSPDDGAPVAGLRGETDRSLDGGSGVRVVPLCADSVRPEGEGTGVVCGGDGGGGGGRRGEGGGRREGEAR